MSMYTDELEALLDESDLGEYDERARRPSVRTPSGRSSFTGRQAPTPASQSQVQAATRNLDAKIETLSNAVKALETRTNGLSADADRTRAALKKELVERRRASDGLRADLQQTKMLSILLPLIQNQTVTALDSDGKEVQVLTQNSNQLATILPFLLLGGTSSEPGKGGFGDPMTLILFALLSSKK
jgi:predicted RNase H-like nuclease (RuvC/YqgF family)